MSFQDRAGQDGAMDNDDDLLLTVLATLARWDHSCPPGPERDRWIDSIARRGPEDPIPPPPGSRSRPLLLHRRPGLH
jgi:hypothetical protein